MTTTETGKYDAECLLRDPHGRFDWTPTVLVESLDEACDFFYDQIEAGKYGGEPGELVEYRVELYDLESPGFLPSAKSILRRAIVKPTA